MIYTKEQKAEMQRLKEEERLSFAEIGRRFNTSGDNVRKVLARLNAGKGRSSSYDYLGAGVYENTAPPDSERAAPDGLTRLHDEFDAKIPYRAASRPKWAGRPPLRIMPKDFQR